MSYLDIESINTFYGRSHVLFDFSFSIEKSEMVCLIGRNGAGKTTAVKSIMGLVPPKTGRILFNDELISGLPNYIIARKGIGYVPEERAIFPNLTLKENLEVAKKKDLPKDESQMDWIYDLFPVLKTLHKRKGCNLSGGQQQMLSIARALMGNPKLLLMDEPTTGLAPLVVAELGSQLNRIKSELTILMVEQNVKFTLNIANKLLVISKGLIQFSGTVDEFISNPQISDRYLAV